VAIQGRPPPPYDPWIAERFPVGRHNPLPRRNGDSGSRPDGIEAPDVADRFRPDVAWTGQADLARLRDGRGSEADGDGVTIGPVGDLAGFHDGARAGLAHHRDGNFKVNLFSPPQRFAVERETLPDRLRGFSLQELSLERDWPELELYFAHDLSPIVASLTFLTSCADGQAEPSASRPLSAPEHVIATRPIWRCGDPGPPPQPDDPVDRHGAARLAMTRM